MREIEEKINPQKLIELMVTRNFLALKTHFDLLHKRLLNRVLYGKMVGVVGSIWVFVWSYVYFVLGFITRFLFRLQANNQRNTGDQIGSRRFECADIDVFGEKEVIDFLVRNGPKDHDESQEEFEDNFDVLEKNSSATTSTNKYEFFSSKDINGYLEQPNALSFTVQELYFGSDEFSSIPKTQEVSSEEDFLSSDSEAETEDVKQETEFSESKTLCTSSIEEVLEKQQEEEENSPESELSEMSPGHDHDLLENSFLCKHDYSEDVEACSENYPVPSGAKPVPNNISGDWSSSEEAFIYSITCEVGEFKHDFSEDVESFLENYSSPSSDAKPVPNNFSGDVSSSEEVIIHSIAYEVEEFMPENDIQAGDENENRVDNIGESLLQEHTDFDEEEYIELEPFIAKSPSASEPKSFSVEEDSGKVENKDEETEDEDEDEEEEEEEGNCQDKRLEFAWEHEDVIEQLKWELRNARTGGLPTIFEDESDSESPTKKEDDHVNLKPVKIDMKFGYKDRINEIQKVYRMYAEKMRKLDILNNQTMHAIGFLQLKDQFKSISEQKPSVPIVKSLLPRKARREVDPIIQYAKKLQNDFELVYVGQVCLCWEILHWQHGKIQDLLQNDDARGSQQYNLVASDFQLFQVLLQRFIEDESFQGPRVPNYVKNRCVIRSLMQVPVVKDDCVKDKQYLMEGNEDAVSCECLAEIVAEAMFTFWEFLRKDEKSHGLKYAQQAITDPVDSKLLLDIKKDFQKKERKVKDIQRSGNCVVKKLQKHQERRVQHALFLAQVELRLVSRVLSMARLSRDQLIWCQQKLNQISVVNRKVHMETSFLLFPC